MKRIHKLLTNSGNCTKHSVIHCVDKNLTRWHKFSSFVNFSLDCWNFFMRGKQRLGQCWTNWIDMNRLKTEMQLKSFELGELHADTFKIFPMLKNSLLKSRENKWKFFRLPHQKGRTVIQMTQHRISFEPFRSALIAFPTRLKTFRNLTSS